jgi:hypothetical protein
MAAHGSIKEGVDYRRFTHNIVLTWVIALMMSYGLLPMLQHCTVASIITVHSVPEQHKWAQPTSDPDILGGAVFDRFMMRVAWEGTSTASIDFWFAPPFITTLTTTSPLHWSIPTQWVCR